MTPEKYRARWGLKSDYPMVAPAYARRRQELAKKIGLGLKRKDAPAQAAEPALEPKAKAARTRKKPAA